MVLCLNQTSAKLIIFFQETKLVKGSPSTIAYT